MRYVRSSVLGVRELTMPLDENNESARPYRCGMVLLCMGALINWLGFAENYEHPVRYIGIACVAAGALLIAGAVFCWAKSAPNQMSIDADSDTQNRDGVHVIDIGDELPPCKPPDYETLTETAPPPTYDEAIRLDPARLPACTSCNKMQVV